jgi:PST family polysaccharide transporter
MALKTALIWSGAQSFTRLALGFLSIKVSAVYLGPAGLALVGQFGNFITLVSGALGNGAQTGVVKLTAENASKHENARSLWGGAMMLSAMLGGLFGLGIAMFSRPLSAWLLESPDYWPVMVLAGLLLPFLQFNLIITGAINGLKWIGRLGAISVVSTITGAMVFIPACYLFGIWGGLIGSAISYGVPFLIALAAAVWSRDINLSDFKPVWNPEIIRSLLRFYPMLLAHAIAVPLATLLVRDILSSKLGLNQAGFWQAGLRLSDMYTQVLMLALSMFLMPHLSSINDKLRFSREMISIVTKVAAMTALAAAAIFILRDWLIPLIFSYEFYPVRDLLPFQLLGDVFKMAGWPIRMVLVIKMRAKWYMFIEAAIAIMQVGLTYLLLPAFGVIGATMAYAASWLAALVVLTVVSREYWNVSSATSN